MTHFSQYQKAPENSPGAFSSASSSLFYLACAVPKTAKKKQGAIRQNSPPVNAMSIISFLSEQQPVSK